MEKEKISSLDSTITEEHLEDLGFRRASFGYGLLWTRDNLAYLSTSEDKGYVRLHTKIKYG
jgi:hypothetical protein